MSKLSSEAIAKRSANLPINTGQINPLGKWIFHKYFQLKESEYKQLDSESVDKDLLLKAKARLAVFLDRGNRKEIIDISKHILNRIDPNANKPIIPDIDLILINYGQINQVKPVDKPVDMIDVIDVKDDNV